MTEKQKKEEKKEEARYRKEDLLKSNKFAESVDAVSVILEDEKTYTIAETEQLINEFLKRKVI